MDSPIHVQGLHICASLLIIIGAIVWTSFQYNYEEHRLNDVKNQLQAMDETQKQQLAILSDIRKQLRSGVTVADGSSVESSGRIRQKNLDGSEYVYYPDLPTTPREPDKTCRLRLWRLASEKHRPGAQIADSLCHQ